jgi:hypothetical protein
VLTDYRSSDLDGDGIEDAWANGHFGHSPLSLAEKLADSDGDGASNLSEFIAGTNPTDAASVLRVTARFAGRAATLEWPCVDGKSYRVFLSGDMRTWREVPNPTFSFPQPAVCRWTDDGQSTGNPGAGMRFYRVAVE